MKHCWIQWIKALRLFDSSFSALISSNKCRCTNVMVADMNFIYRAAKRNGTAAQIMYMELFRVGICQSAEHLNAFIKCAKMDFFFFWRDTGWAPKVISELLQKNPNKNACQQILHWCYNTYCSKSVLRLTIRVLKVLQFDDQYSGLFSHNASFKTLHLHMKPTYLSPLYQALHS